MRNGELYQLEVRFESKRRMVFHDSLKLLPGSLGQSLALLRLSYFLAWASRNPIFCTRWLELSPVLLLWLQSTTSSSTGLGILPRTSASSDEGSTYCRLYFRFGVKLHLLALHECHFPLCLFPAGACLLNLLFGSLLFPPPYRCCTLCYGQVRSLLRS